MHCCLEGVVKQILRLFIKVRRRPFSLKKKLIEELNEIIESLKFPSEFCRQPRTLQELNFFKATEFRRFLLYDGPVILKFILSPIYYNNFLKLSCAFRIFLDDEDCIRNNECARQLLKSFVEEFNILFGDSAMTFNEQHLLNDRVITKTFPILKNKYLENCFKSASFKNFKLTTYIS